MVLFFDVVLLYLGPATPNNKDSASSSKDKKEDKPKKDDLREKEREKEKEKGNRQSASFPPTSNTTDAVRLKCRELLSNAIKGSAGRCLTSYFPLPHPVVYLIFIILTDLSYSV